MTPKSKKTKTTTLEEKRRVNYEKGRGGWVSGGKYKDGRVVCSYGETLEVIWEPGEGVHKVRDVFFRPKKRFRIEHEENGTKVAAVHTNDDGYRVFPYTVQFETDDGETLLLHHLEVVDPKWVDDPPPPKKS